MKKYIYILNIMLIALIPVTILVNGKDETIKYKTDATTQTKMVKTTVFLENAKEAVKAKQIEEEEKKKEEEAKEAEKKEEVAKLEKIEEQKRIEAAKTVTPVKTQEVVSSRAGGSGEQVTNVVSNSDKRVFQGAKFYNRKMSSYGTDCCRANNYTDEEKSRGLGALGLGMTAIGYQMTFRNIYFNAGGYGNVRMVAADHAGKLDFPLATIVKITEKMDDGSYTSFNAIVLDRGDKNIGLDSKYIFDLVSESQVAARRWGVHGDIEVEVLKLGTVEDQRRIRNYGHL